LPVIVLFESSTESTNSARCRPCTWRVLRLLLEIVLFEIWRCSTGNANVRPEILAIERPLR
jgi:hypothetical protein